jgi:hypothetical protein
MFGHAARCMDRVQTQLVIKNVSILKTIKNAYVDERDALVHEMLSVAFCLKIPRIKPQLTKTACKPSLMMHDKQMLSRLV